ncbi:dTDP-4-dehydrorhamnose reductase [Kosmotoga pacifica]|uniref:dTDP-4-dehydrorhamnose reductase n=1 Tax=Kosmotoga pacifica TaxID=1330330 RepID=A0A0G2ZAM8_9BACT|nr:dTDP-4-dehydrorhamnose reductase [Kosmotoga pacifica]AKI96634.1 dTDP-4-dehydrorhamnose reductase [Kosmotoga pacifica]
MRILITGANGQLGKDFQKLFDREGIDCVATDFITAGGTQQAASGEQRSNNQQLSTGDQQLLHLDITDLQSIRKLATDIKPDVIINCAAYNAVDKAEVEWEKAYTINGVGVRNLAIVANELNAILVHYSTDYVFDGNKKEPYTIFDLPNPLSRYGESKFLGEKLLVQTGGKFILIRTSWVFGAGNINFAKKVLEWAQKNGELKIVTDEISVPTYTVDLAQATWTIINKRAYGLYHISNEGECSRYEYASYILEKIGWHGKLLPAKQKDFDFPAKRPKYSKLSNFGLKETVNIEMPDWKNAVDRFLKETGAV